ncbi:MAG: thioredoxin domain-containing protein [Deltaproteobacteria bacterium]
MKNSCANRLAGEKSPYLLQHSHEPVDWRPWGPEAFEEARRRDVPVFLSIGYSACHWCHVMSQESFNDPRIAGMINENFIPVKVDREEHPDLDNYFIKAVTSVAGSAGWPLTVFLTPDKQPFYGGTYFPPEDSDGTPGLTTVLGSVSSAWKQNRIDLLQFSKQITSIVSGQAISARGQSSVDESLLRKGYELLSNNFDPSNGGFGVFPKFPTPFYIQFLLRYHRRYREPMALRMAEKTLYCMAAGGIRDQLEGGFHRYSTDDRWFLPHFEKMLYDQALISRAYFEAYQATGTMAFAEIGRETIDFVLSQMAWNEGGFFSSLDADSVSPRDPRVKKEGIFYLWPKSDIDELLGRDSEAFCYRYGVKPEGNVAVDPAGEFTGYNILYEAHSQEETGAYCKLPAKRLLRVIQAGKQRLLGTREGRPWPAIDQKILCDWNSMMISALCFAHRLFPRQNYRHHALAATRMILDHMRDPSGGLFHQMRDFEADIPGMLDDYAYLTCALIDLYETGFDIRHLKEALRTAALMVELFWDDEHKGFFINSPRSTEPQFVQKELYDGAVPSGNAAALSALLRLSALTGQAEWKRLADEMVQAYSGELMSVPYSYVNLLVPLFLYFGPVRQVTVAAPNARSASVFIDSIACRFFPDTVLAVRPWQKDKAAEAVQVIPSLKEQQTVNGKAVAYVCSQGTCSAPARDTGELIKALDGAKNG